MTKCKYLLLLVLLVGCSGKDELYWDAFGKEAIDCPDAKTTVKPFSQTSAIHKEFVHITGCGLKICCVYSKDIYIYIYILFFL